MPQTRRTLARLAALAIAIFAMALPAVSRANAPQVGISGGDSAGSKQVVPPGLEDVGIFEHLDGQIPMDAVFRDSTGKMVKFGDLFDGKSPVVLTLAYHTCPTVCSLVQSQTVETLKLVKWSLGEQYRAITLSFDPRETTERSAEKRRELIADYGRPVSDSGWAFLTGDDTNIHRVTDAVGFKYHYVEREQQFAHPTAIMILKPNGEVARYLYGLEYSPKDVTLGLLEASNGRSITTVERVLLYCYHYDPNSGRYALMATRVMQIGGGFCGLLLVTVLASFWIKELVKARKARKSPTLQHGAPERSSAAH